MMGVERWYVQGALAGVGWSAVERWFVADVGRMGTGEDGLVTGMRRGSRVCWVRSAN